MKDDGLDVDYSERAGYLTGKSAALAEWKHRKEEAEYQRLFRRLRDRNYKRLRAEERLRDLPHEIVVKDTGKVHRRLYPIVCCVCHAEVTKRQPNARYCSRRCRNRYHDAPRARARNRGMRNMLIRASMLAHLELRPGLTLGELHARMPEAKYGSLASLLCEQTKAGVLTSEPAGIRNTHRYRLASL